MAEQHDIRWTPAYDIDISTLPDPREHIGWEDFDYLETSPDLLQRAAFWAFLAANRAEEREDTPIAINARQDAHMLLHLADGLMMQDRIIVRRDTIAHEYVERSSIQKRSVAIAVISSLVTIIIFAILEKLL